MKSESGIKGHTPARAAEEPPQRLAARLALNVPERGIDSSHCLRGKAGLAARRQRPVKLLANKLGRQRIVAEDRRSNDLVDDRANHRLAGDPGKPVTNNTSVGFHLDEARFERALAFDAGQ